MAARAGCGRLRLNHVSKLLAAAIGPVVGMVGAPLAREARAEIKTFGDTATEWNVASNWTPVGVPGVADDAVIAGGSRSILVDQDISLQSVRLVRKAQVWIMAGAPNNITVTLPNVPGSGTGTPTYISVEGGGALRTSGEIGWLANKRGRFLAAEGSTLEIDGSITEGLESVDLTFDASGTILLRGTSTYTGATTIEATAHQTERAWLYVRPLMGLKGSGRLASTSSVTIGTGATLSLDNFDSAHSNRINDAATIHLGGTLEIIDSATTPVAEEMGELSLSGHGRIVIPVVPANRPESGPPMARFASLSRTPDATLSIHEENELGFGHDLNVGFVSPPTVTNGIVGAWATVNGQYWMTVSASGKAAALAGQEAAPSAWTPTMNALVSSAQSVSSDAEVNTLKLASSASITIDPGVTLRTKGVVKGVGGGGAGGTISGGFISAPFTDQHLFLWNSDPDNALTISSSILDNNLGGIPGLGLNVVKAGLGTVVLSGSNSFGGSAIINEGTLELHGLQPMGGGVTIHADTTLRLASGADIGPGHDVQLGSGAATMEVPSGSASIRSLVIPAGTLQAGSSWNFRGGGSLSIEGTSTYSGDLHVRGQSGANLLLGRSDGRMTSVASVHLHGGTLTLDNTDDQQTDRVNDLADVYMDGGTLTMNGHDGVTTVETMRNIRVLGGTSNLPVGHNPLNRPAILNFTCRFIDGRGTMNYGVGNGGHVTFSTSPSMSSGILSAQETVNDVDWATLDVAGEVVAYTGYETSPNAAIWSPASNVWISTAAPVQSVGNRTINTLKLTNSARVITSGELQSDGILADGGNSEIFGTGSFTVKSTTSGAKVITVKATATGVMGFSVPITDHDGPVDVVKWGAGTMILNAPATYSGTTYIHEGTVQATEFANLLDSYVHMEDDGVLSVSAGTTPFSVGGLSGGGEVQLARGIITLKPSTGTSQGKFSGVISGGGSVTVGPGSSLALSGVNTYTGETVVHGSMLLEGDGALSGSTSLKLGPVNGGVERPGFGFVAGSSSRFNPQTDVEMNSATFYEHRGLLADYPQTNLDALLISSGGNFIHTDAGGIQFNSLTRNNGSNLNWDFQGGGTLKFTTSPTLGNGIVGAFATVNGRDWMTIDGAGRAVAYSDYTIEVNATNWLATQNIAFDASVPDMTVISSDATSFTHRQDYGQTLPEKRRDMRIMPGVTFHTNGFLDAGENNMMTGGGSVTAVPGSNELHMRIQTTFIRGNVAMVDNGDAVSLVKSGPGTLVLNAADTHTGTTYINEGTIAADALASLSHSPVHVSAGAMLEVMPGDNLFELGGLSGGGDVALSRGIITVKAGSGSTGSTHSGRISGTGSVTFTGGGTLALSGISTYTGKTTNQGGVLVVLSRGALTGTSEIEVTKGGSFVLDGTRSTDDGEIKTFTMRGGSLQIQNQPALQTIDFATLRMLGGANAIKISDTANTNDGTIRFTGTVFQGRSSVNLDLAPGGTVNFISPPALRSGIVGAFATYNDVDWSTIDGTGNAVPFSAYDTSPPASWTKNSNVLVTSTATLSLPSLTTISTLKLATGGTHDITTGGELAVDGILLASGEATISGTAPMSAKSPDSDGGKTIYLRTAAGTTLHVTKPAADPTEPVNLAKSGAGTVVIDSSVSGEVDIDEGTLELGQFGVIYQATNISTTGVFNPGDWDKTIGGLSGDGSVTLGTGGELSVGANNRSTTFSGVIGGAGALTKVGTGTLSLLGDNTYTGQTTVAQGTLNLQRMGGDILIHGDSALRVGDGTTLVGSRDIIVVVPGTAFKIGGGSSPSQPSVINVESDTILRVGGNVGINELIPDTKLHVRGRGTLELEQPASHTGGTIVTGAMVLTGTAGALPATSSLTIADGGLLQIGGPSGAANRIADAAPINLAGGTIQQLPGTTATETLGQVTLSKGDSRFEGKYYIAAVRHRTGATVGFTPSGGDITFASPPVLVNDVIGPWATYTDPTTGQIDYASLESAPGGTRIYPKSGYWSASESTWDGTKVVSVDSDITLSGSRSVYAMKVVAPPIGGPCTVTPAVGQSLRTNAVLASGSVVFAPGGSMTATDAQDFIIHVPSSTDTVTLGSNITDNSGGPVDLVVSGGGTVVLNGGDNSYTGQTKVSRTVLKSFFQTGDKPTQSQFSMMEGTLDVTAHDQTIGSLAGTGKVMLGDHKLIVGLNGMSSTYEGEFVSSTGGGIKKIGAGTLTITSPPNTNGELDVSSGNMRLRINELEAKLQAFGLLSSVRLGGTTTEGVLELEGAAASGIMPATAIGDGNGRINKIRVAYSRPLTISSLSGTGHFTDQGGASDYVAPIAASGGMTIKGSVVNINLAGALPNMPSITIEDGGTLRYFKDATSAGSNRINDAATINLDGGRVLAIQTGTAPTSETMGALNLRKYDAALSYLPGDSVIYNQTIYQALSVSPGATGDFHLEGNNHVCITSPPTLNNGIISPGVTVNGLDFATVNGTGELVPYAAYQTDQDPVKWGTGDNVDLTGDVTIEQDTSVFTLRRAPGAVARAASLSNGAFLQTNAILTNGEADIIDGTGHVSAQDAYSNFVAVPDRVNRKLIFAVPVTNNNSGPVNLIKGGDGTLVLAAANTLTGRTIIGSGTLRLEGNGQLAASTVDVAAGALLEIDTNASIGGLQSASSIYYATGTAPRVTIGDTKTVNIGSNNASTTFAGEISGAGSLVKRGSGTLTLTGPNTHTGATIIEGGEMVFADGSTLPNSNGVELRSLAKLTIQPEKGDKVEVMFNPREYSVTRAGGTLEVGASDDVDPPMVTMGSMVWSSAGNLTRSASELGLTNVEQQRSAGATAHFETVGKGAIYVQQSTVPVNGIIAPWMTITNSAGQTDFASINDWGTGDWAIFNGTKWEKIDNTDSVTGSTDALTWLPSDNVKVSAPLLLLTIDGPTVINTLKLERQRMLRNNNVISTKAVLTTGVGDITMDGTGTLTAPTGTNELVVHAHGTGGNFKITQHIADNAAPVSLVKTGPQKLVLDAAMSHTGKTVVNEGTLELGQFASLIDSVLNLADDHALLGLREYNNTIGGLAGGGGTVQTVTGSVLNIQQSSDTNFAGVMVGNGEIVKLRTGKLTLTGDSSLSGAMTIEGGTLELADGGALSNVLTLKLKRGRDLKHFRARLDGSNQINDTATIDVSDADVDFIAAAGASSPVSETVGPLVLSGGANRVGYKQMDVMFGGGVTRAAHSTVLFDRDAAGGSLAFAEEPEMTNGIIGGYATRSVDDGTIKSYTWAAIGAGGTVVPFNAFADAPTTWNAFTNGRYVLRAGVPLRFDVHSLMVKGDGSGLPSTLSLDAGISLIDSGGLLATGTSGHVINGVGTLSSWAGDLFVHVPDGDHTFTVQAAITNNPFLPAWTVSLVKAGAGTLVLDGQNSYTGTTYINEGTVKLGVNGTIRAADINRDGILDVVVASKTIDSLSGSGGQVKIGATDFTIAQATNTTYSGDVTGTGSVTKRLGGTIAIGTDWTLGGSVHVLDGALVLNNGASLPNTSGVTLRTVLTTYDDPDANVGVSGTPKHRMPAASTLSLEGGTLDVIFGTDLGRTDVTGLLVASSGDGVVSLTGSGVLQSGSMSRAPGSTIRVRHTQFEGGGTGLRLVSPPTLSNGIIGGYATIAVDANTNLDGISDWATVDASGMVVPYTGYTNSNNASAWAATQNINLTGNTSVSGNKTINSLRFNSTASPMTLSISGSSNLVLPAGILKPGTAYRRIAGGSITSGPGPSTELFATVPHSSGTLEISSSIVNNGTGSTSLVKSGNGTLLLSGTNSYSGLTYVNGGTLAVSSANALGDGGTNNGITLAGGTIKPVVSVDASNRDVAVMGSGTVDTNGLLLFSQDVDGNLGLDRLIIKGGGLYGTESMRVDRLRVMSSTSGVTTAQVGLSNVPNRTSRVGELTMDPGTKLDVRERRRLVLVNRSFGDGSSLVASGYNGGSWDGPGIMTGAAEPNVTGLAVASAADLAVTTFGDLAVSSTDLCIMFSYAGDANLSGNVDADDYFQIDSNYNKPDSEARFFTGDFNFDNTIDGDDFFIIDNSFVGQSGSLGGGFPVAGVTAVPEPASIAMIALASTLLARRRRRS